MLSSLKFVCNSCCWQNQVKTRKGENLRWLRDGRRRVRPLRIAHACFRSLAKPLAYRVPVYWGTSRLRVGSWCHRLGFIVIFLSSHSSLVRTGTSSAANITGWYKIKKERNVKTHIRQSSLRLLMNAYYLVLLCLYLV